MESKIKRFATSGTERAKMFFSWLERMGDPVSKWGPTIMLLIGGLWAYYLFAVSGASDWAINLNISTEVIPYHDNLALLVVHVRSRNPRNSKVSLNPPNDAFKLMIKELPKGADKGSIIDPNDNVDPKGFSMTVNLLPKDGYDFDPGADFEDATAVVLPIGTKVWLTTELDYRGDFVSTSNIAVVEPQASEAKAAH